MPATVSHAPRDPLPVVAQPLSHSAANRRSSDEGGSGVHRRPPTWQLTCRLSGAGSARAFKINRPGFVAMSAR